MPRDKKSLSFQAVEQLKSHCCFGTSKHEAQLAARAQAIASGQKALPLEGIYSYSTYHDYAKHCKLFAHWARATHGCDNLQEARQYVDEWLITVRSKFAPSTQKLDVAALSKLYGCTSTDFAPTPPRRRQDIKRSRGPAVRDKHFSVKNNAELIAFCRGTGLRRHEIEKLTGDALVYIDNAPYLHIRGKNGKWRDAPIVGPAVADIVARCQASENNALVWSRVSRNADVHGYRRDYAKVIYGMYARDVATLQRKERYDCRGDLRGTHWDRAAMLVASRALGHNRLNVIAGHYLT